ncbi:MAG: PIN domain-containing protein [Pyrinomonadaceae bacterium]|nr:PIN domain-containing protein [Pyrinomonadaceae bacterium]
MAFLLDSGFLYAQLNGRDDHHAEVSAASRISEREPIILPIPAITEITYLLQRDLGIEAVATFLENLSETDFILETPTAEDYRRAAEILRKYNDANIDFVDAVIAAIAERLNITKILTVDRRHFGAFKPRHCAAFSRFPSAYSVLPKLFR